MSDNLDKKIEFDGGGETVPPSPAPEEEKPKGARRGPKPKNKDGEPSPLPVAVPNRQKKDPADIADPYAAIHRTHAAMVAHVENLRKLHPESPCGDPVNPLETVKTPGAPIKKTAFHAPLVGLCRLAGFVGDLEKEEMPEQGDYDRAADAWADASTHLGLSEKAAAVFSAVSETVSVVGFTAAKSVKKFIMGGKPKPPKAEDVAPLNDKREVERADG